MKIEEIEKMLFMLDSDDLISLKEYLIEEKKQKYFEKYCSNQNPRIKQERLFYSDNCMQVFTNGASFYIIGGNRFNINTPKVKSLITQGKIKLIQEDTYNKFVNRTRNLYGELDSSWFERKNYDNHVEILYHNIYYNNKLLQARFEKIELLFSKILLDNPKYKISYENPIIKAESENGKAYIFGEKNY